LRVLVTGAGGGLGQDVVRVFDGDRHHEVIAATRRELDLTDRDSIFRAITSAEPDAIVHGGAWTAVDACESDPDLAFRVNALGTRHVQHAARIVGAQVFYVSTDFVFDGTQSEPIDEWSPANPRSVYARSKYGGELEIDPGHTIIRTRGGTGFVKTMLRLASERDELRVVADQVGNPTYPVPITAMLAMCPVWQGACVRPKAPGRGGRGNRASRAATAGPAGGARRCRARSRQAVRRASGTRRS
jgi:dTDP-4-dehydrorhamnose reductase